ncbi:ribonuclease-like 3 [Arapaima gigas]
MNIQLQHRALVLLLVLCAVVSVYSQPDDVKPRYVKFLTQHFKSDMQENKCTSVIKARDIHREEIGKKKCKDVNTFIYSTPKNTIKDVCGKAGTENAGPNGSRLFTSTKPFPVIKCTIKSGERPPHCEYRGHKSTRKIRIACDKGWPVHYDGDIVVP